jgi:hypothetical protein
MLALDEPRETDEVFEIDGFRYVVDKTFFNKFKPIKVSFSPVGFKITAAVNYGESYFSHRYHGSR